MAEAFGIMVQAGINAKDNLISIFKEIWAYIKSGGKDPIEFKTKGLMEGIDLKGDGKFRMPEFGGFSSVDNQLDELDRQAAERQQAREDAKAAAGAKAAIGAQAQAQPMPAGEAGPDFGKAKDKEASHTDLASYASKLQESIFGKDKDKELLDVNKQQLANLKQIAAKNPPANPGFAI